MIKSMQTLTAKIEMKCGGSYSRDRPGSQNRLRIGDLDLLTEALRE
jgi:hypothetical protein